MHSQEQPLLPWPVSGLPQPRLSPPPSCSPSASPSPWGGGQEIRRSVPETLAVAKGQQRPSSEGRRSKGTQQRHLPAAIIPKLPGPFLHGSRSPWINAHQLYYLQASALAAFSVGKNALLLPPATHLPFATQLKWPITVHLPRLTLPSCPGLHSTAKAARGDADQWFSIQGDFNHHGTSGNDWRDIFDCQAWGRGGRCYWHLGEETRHAARHFIITG